MGLGLSAGGCMGECWCWRLVVCVRMSGGCEGVTGEGWEWVVGIEGGDASNTIFFLIYIYRYVTM